MADPANMSLSDALESINSSLITLEARNKRLPDKFKGLAKILDSLLHTLKVSGDPLHKSSETINDAEVDFVSQLQPFIVSLDTMSSLREELDSDREAVQQSLAICEHAKEYSESLLPRTPSQALTSNPASSIAINASPGSMRKTNLNNMSCRPWEEVDTSERYQGVVHRVGTVTAGNNAHQTIAITSAGRVELGDVSCSNGSHQFIGSMTGGNLLSRLPACHDLERDEQQGTD
ncbi:hypothetical protein BDW69DRAFT_88747 [Aspergillus filifer]